MEDSMDNHVTRHGFKYRIRYKIMNKPIGMLKDIKYLVKYSISPMDMMIAVMTVLGFMLIAWLVPMLNHSFISMLSFAAAGILISWNLLDKTEVIGNGFVKSGKTYKLLKDKKRLNDGSRLKNLYSVRKKDNLPRIANGMYVIAFEADGFYTSEIALGDVATFSARLADFYLALSDNTVVMVDVTTKRQKLTKILNDLEARANHAEDKYTYALTQSYLSQGMVADSIPTTEERMVIILQSSKVEELMSDVNALGLIRGTVLNSLKRVSNEEAVRLAETYTGSNLGRGVKLNDLDK